MSVQQQFHPEFVTDSDGNKKAVILPLAEYEELLEDLDDLAVAAERKDEPTISHEQLMAGVEAGWPPTRLTALRLHPPPPFPFPPTFASPSHFARSRSPW